ncbi:MAG: PBP1A family penicillin-binding protein [Acidobacteria bacterium]|uniref:PBP1A family penicillin-binding protein n=1 Tax=Candidatus Polarisedimenticola svalbardensis TaxID=2886004 RepID=A0A8J6XZC2_9BACT|nr:PBP1A family penicillin-binding protein [Candidatus Polarisedimenticola svalbardensis]
MELPKLNRLRKGLKKPYLVLACLVLAAAVAGGSLGYFMRLDLPDVRVLEDYNPPLMTRVYAVDGRMVDTFAEQRRILVDYQDIPRSFLEALIATEDTGFYDHTGVGMRGIVRAALSDLRKMRLEEGFSTITMQLVRSLTNRRQKTIQRKLEEMLLALEVERNYTKEEILQFYCNQVYMGHGRYGLEAAARHYFGKPARELTLGESSLLVGVIQRPESLTPYRHPERAVQRRAHVLNRMVQVGFLDADTAVQVRDEPLALATSRSRKKPARYYVEEVRRWLKARYGDTSVYKEGLEVRTTLDLSLQTMADQAMDFGLRELDKRQGWRGVTARVPEGEDPGLWSPPSWDDGLEVGAVVDGVVTAVEGSRADVRIGEYTGSLRKAQIAWTRAKSPGRILSTGDLVRVRLLELNEDGTAGITLEQEPAVEAALVALNPASGEILALSGGFDFDRSEWNRATQARRQTGSAFKPFVFATALANGWTLSDTILDEPTVFLDPRTLEPYQPENFSNTYYGTLTVRTALEKSANIATVKLLDQVGYNNVLDIAKRLGITADLRPYPSLGLGAFEISLLELTSAYGTFANEGVRVEPHFVTEVRDSSGAVLSRIEPRVQDAVSPQTAYLMNRCLAGVITDGTGRRASNIQRALAGKTGTTDGNTDAWFVGYGPDLAVGVWVGFDAKKSLGSRETGALAALPIWKHFMEAVTTERDDVEFRQPPGITVVAIDRNTGLRANPAAGCTPVFSEVFAAGSEPTRYCSRSAHRVRELPYSLQRYEFNEDGELEIPSVELDALLAVNLSFQLSADGRSLTASGAGNRVTVPLRRIPGGDAGELPARIQRRVDPSEWVGHDGRRARVILVRR